MTSRFFADPGLWVGFLGAGPDTCSGPGGRGVGADIVSHKGPGLQTFFIDHPIAFMRFMAYDKDTI